MRVLDLHPWDVSPREALEIQKRLKGKLALENDFDPDRVERIAGADVSYDKASNRVYAAAIVLSYPDLRIIEEKQADLPAKFPYVPGLLVFREGPALIKAFEQIERAPDLIMFDGQGIAHPRGIGIATHMGIFLDKPSIGVAKTVLVGEYREPASGWGSCSPLTKDGREIGVALRTKEKVAPVFVSIGHKIDLPTAVEFVLRCCQGYRLPEPSRQAHILANRSRAAGFSQPSLF
ncbi:MAG: deoxyribonuclease V [Actinomycetota bacterium]|nr:deoxyribonuclease V [Actinomycetota bacterium]